MPKIIFYIYRGAKMKKHAKLKGLRNQCDLSQKKVGEQLGITAQAYSSKENGKTQFTYSECLVIRDMLAERLGITITIDELFA